MSIDFDGHRRGLGIYSGIPAHRVAARAQAAPFLDTLTGGNLQMSKSEVDGTSIVDPRWRKSSDE